MTFAQSDENLSDQNKTNDILEIIAIIIGSAAIVFSALSLWKTHLSPFDLEVSFTSPTISLDKIGEKDNNTSFLSHPISESSISKTAKLAKEEDKIYEKIWWIPSIKLDITFHNKGQKPGKVIDLRFLMELLDKKEKPNKFALYAKWIIDQSKFLESSGRGEWLESAVQGDWYPQIISPKETRTLHIILETSRWDEKLSGKWKMKLEYYDSRSKRWNSVDEIETFLSDDDFEIGGGHGFYNTLGGIREPFDNYFFKSQSKSKNKKS